MINILHSFPKKKNKFTIQKTQGTLKKNLQRPLTIERFKKKKEEIFPALIIGHILGYWVDFYLTWG